MLEKNPPEYLARPPEQYKYLLNMIGVPHNMLSEECRFSYIQAIEANGFDYFVGTAVKLVWLFKSIENLKAAKWHLERFCQGKYHLLAIDCLQGEIEKLEIIANSTPELKFDDADMVETWII